MRLDPRLAAFRPDLADARLKGEVEAERHVEGLARRVSAHRAFLRRAPAPDAPVDSEVLFGEELLVFEERDGWAWVQMQSDSYVGYLPCEALCAAGEPATHRVASLRTFLYARPDLKSPLQGWLSMNSAVRIEDREGPYARVAGAGWVFASHLCGRDEFAPDFVCVAELFLHAPYLWGGKSSLGLDCSALVQMALAAAGRKAPRDTDMQEASLGAPVEKDGGLEGLARGDLVFWKGHVAIMLDAARIIHANGHSMSVAIEPLAQARERIQKVSFGPITSIRRLPDQPPNQRA